MENAKTLNLSSYDEPQYSKKKVQNAGKALRKELESSVELDIFNNWRSSHAFPLDIISDVLLQVSSSVDPNALLAKRLKRSPSIINKLKMQPSMSLSNMQDIGGCRAIVTSVEDVYRVTEIIKGKLKKHVLVNEDDYIKKPKSSGYRGIHLVYKFNSEGVSEKHNGLMVEIQIRSRSIHYWATAVETMGAYLKQALKSNQGDMNVLQFFTLVGDLFAWGEKIPLHHQSYDIDKIVLDIRMYLYTLKIVEKLKAFSFVTKMIQNREETSDYYLIILNMQEKKIRIRGVNTDSIIEANKHYTKLEVRFKNDPRKDVVLVSAKKLDELKETYPNYFSDTKEFIEHLRKSLENASNQIDKSIITINQSIVSVKGSLKRTDRLRFMKKMLVSLKRKIRSLYRKKRVLTKKMKNTSDPDLRENLLYVISEIDTIYLSSCKRTANVQEIYLFTKLNIRNRHSKKAFLKKNH